MKKIMVRADDLGYSEAVNYGIAKSVKDGIIKNVGFMVNMDATLHGYDLLKNEDCCLGLHTNICVGKPVCDVNDIPSIVGKNGEFRTSKEYRKAERDFVVLEEVVREIEAQYERFKEITGREPSYFEGHAVQSPNFMKGLCIVAERHGLKFCDSVLDGSPFYVNGQKMYAWMESMKEGYDPRKTLFRMIEQAHEDAFDMLIFHPGYLDDYILKKSSLTIARTLEVEAACSKEVKQYLLQNNIKLYTYDEV